MKCKRCNEEKINKNVWGVEGVRYSTYNCYKCVVEFLENDDCGECGKELDKEIVCIPTRKKSEDIRELHYTCKDCNIVTIKKFIICEMCGQMQRPYTLIECPGTTKTNDACKECALWYDL